MKNSFKNGNAYLVVAVLIMAILFYSSSMTYTQQSQVGLISRVLVNEPFKNHFATISFVYAGGEVSLQNLGYAKFVEFFIRKAAHFSTYFILGGSLFLGVKAKMNLMILPACLGWLAATGYAALDEFHQMVTGGRSPLFQDVMLDSIGAATAVIICLVVSYLKKRK